MRTITRRALVGLAIFLLFLLALGALPSLLKSGDPYYLTAEPTDATLSDPNATMANASELSDRTYRYTWAALRDAAAGGGNDTVGRSHPYWQGPIGLKETFTHSPFDELESHRTRYPSAFVGEDELLVRWENQTYRLALVGG